MRSRSRSAGPPTRPVPGPPLHLAVLASLAGACGGDARPDRPEGTAPSVRDSAGVTIVESPSPAWGESPEWRIEAEPAAVLSGTGDPGFALFRVADLALLPDGAIAVANGGAGEVAVLEPDGRLRTRLGRTGDGPGEFRWLNGVLARGDSVVAVDGARLRFSVFAPDGTLTRDFAVDPEPGQPTGIRAVGMGADGVAVFRELGFAEKLQPGVLRLPGTAFRLAWSGERAADLPGEFPGGAIFVLSDGMGTLPMGPDLALAAGPGRFLVGLGDAPEIREYGPDGRLRRRIRWGAEVRPVTSSLQDRWKAAELEGIEEILADETPEARQLALEKQRKFHERLPFPATLPVLTDLLLDDTGHLWVRRYLTRVSSDTPTSWQGKPLGPDASLETLPESWWIFDPDGRWLGSVEIPPGLRVEVATTDAVWGVHRDALGVETIRRHPLRRDPAP